MSHLPEFSRTQETAKICLSQQDTKSQEPGQCEEGNSFEDTSNIDDGDMHNMGFLSLMSVESSTSDVNISSTKKLYVQRLKPIHICPYSDANVEKNWLQGHECPGPMHIEGAAQIDIITEEINYERFSADRSLVIVTKKQEELLDEKFKSDTTPSPDNTLPMDSDYIVSGSHLQEIWSKNN